MIFFWDNACLTDLGGVLWCVALWYLHSIQIQNIWALLDKIASSDRQSHLQLSESCFKFWVSQIFGLSLAFSRPAFWHWPDALHCVGEPWSQPIVLVAVTPLSYSPQLQLVQYVGEIWKLQAHAKGSHGAGNAGEGLSMGTATWQWGRRSLLVALWCELGKPVLKEEEGCKGRRGCYQPGCTSLSFWDILMFRWKLLNIHLDLTFIKVKDLKV